MQFHAGGSPQIKQFTENAQSRQKIGCETLDSLLVHTSLKY